MPIVFETSNCIEWFGDHIFMYSFYIQFLGPKLLGFEPDTKKLEEYRQMLQSSLKTMERHFLKDTKFINSNEISIADLHAACELTQFWLTDEDVVSDKPKVSQWLSSVQSTLSPHFDEVHKMVYLARKKGVLTSKL